MVCPGIRPCRALDNARRSSASPSSRSRLGPAGGAGRRKEGFEMAFDTRRTGRLCRSCPASGKTPGRCRKLRNGTFPGRISRQDPRLPCGAPSYPPHGRSGRDARGMEAQTPRRPDSGPVPGSRRRADQLRPVASGLATGGPPPGRSSGPRDTSPGRPVYPDVCRNDAPALPHPVRGPVLVSQENPLADPVPVRGKRNREPLMATRGRADPVVRLGTKQADRGRSRRYSGPFHGRTADRADVHGRLHLGRGRKGRPTERPGAPSGAVRLGGRGGLGPNGRSVSGPRVDRSGSFPTLGGARAYRSPFRGSPHDPGSAGKPVRQGRPHPSLPRREDPPLPAGISSPVFLDRTGVCTVGRRKVGFLKRPEPVPVPSAGAQASSPDRDPRHRPIVLRTDLAVEGRSPGREETPGGPLPGHHEPGICGEPVRPASRIPEASSGAPVVSFESSDASFDPSGCRKPS